MASLAWVALRLGVLRTTLLMLVAAFGAVGLLVEGLR
jgi:hypothetical protein